MDLYPAAMDHTVLPVLEQRAFNLTHGFPVTQMAFEIATAHLITTLIVQIVASVVFFARVYTRVYPAFRFHLDDYIITIAYLLMTVAFCLWYRCNMWAWGLRHPDFRSVDEVEYNSMIGSIALPFWAWATGLTKIGIGVMLLRFLDSKRWKAVVYVMIACNVLLIGFVGVANLFQCIPYSAVWDFKRRYNRKEICWKPVVNLAILYSSSVCNVLTDLVFSIMPLTFLHKIRRPLRERIVIGVLMALGLVASAFSLSKAIVNGRLPYSKNGSAMLVFLGLVSCLEVQTSLIAACIPTLRNSTHRWLRQMGFGTQTERGSMAYAGATSTIGGSSSKGRAKRVRESDLLGSYSDGKTVGSGYRELDEVEMESGRGGPASIGGAGGIMCVTEMRVHSSHSGMRDEWRRGANARMEDQWDRQQMTGMENRI